MKKQKTSVDYYVFRNGQLIYLLQDQTDDLNLSTFFVQMFGFHVSTAQKEKGFYIEERNNNTGVVTNYYDNREIKEPVINVARQKAEDIQITVDWVAYYNGVRNMIENPVPCYRLSEDLFRVQTANFSIHDHRLAQLHCIDKEHKKAAELWRDKYNELRRAKTFKDRQDLREICTNTAYVIDCLAQYETWHNKTIALIAMNFNK